MQAAQRLTAKDLSFAYDEEKVILSHAETQVHTGEIVALTGENGSGKSTFTKLLIGFYTPTGGEVELKIGNKTVHGAEIRNYLSYDSGFVSVFAGTLKENICMDQPFDEKKFRKAVELANLTEFVNEKQRTTRSSRRAKISPAVSAARSLWRAFSTMTARSSCSTSPPQTSIKPPQRACLRL